MTCPKLTATQHHLSSFVPSTSHGNANVTTSPPLMESRTHPLLALTLLSSGFLTTLTHPPNYISPTTSTTYLQKLPHATPQFEHTSYANNSLPTKGESQSSTMSSRTISTNGSHNSLIATQLALSCTSNNPYSRNYQQHSINTSPL